MTVRLRCLETHSKHKVLFSFWRTEKSWLVQWNYSLLIHLGNNLKKKMMKIISKFFKSSQNPLSLPMGNFIGRDFATICIIFLFLNYFLSFFPILLTLRLVLFIRSRNQIQKWPNTRQSFTFLLHEISLEVGTPEHRAAPWNNQGPRI